MGFYGAGSLSGYGNLWFQQMAVSAGVDHLYVQNDGNTALWDFFKAIDTSDDHVISATEISGLDLRVCGYSWGGVSAIGFTQKISEAPVTIVVGGSPNNPISYRLEVPIPVTVLLTIDPVPILNPPGTVPSTVQHYINYYQQRGGTVFSEESQMVGRYR